MWYWLAVGWVGCGCDAVETVMLRLGCVGRAVVVLTLAAVPSFTCICPRKPGATVARLILS